MMQSASAMNAVTIKQRNNVPSANTITHKTNTPTGCGIIVIIVNVKNVVPSLMRKPRNSVPSVYKAWQKIDIPTGCGKMMNSVNVKSVVPWKRRHASDANKKRWKTSLPAACGLFHQTRQGSACNVWTRKEKCGHVLTANKITRWMISLYT